MRLLAAAGAGRQLGCDVLAGQCLLYALVKGRVEFRRRNVRRCKRGMQRQAVSPVVAVVNDAAAGGPTAKVDAFGHDRFDFVQALGVAKGDRGFCPAVVPENRSSLRRRVEQGGINGHVGCGIVGCAWQDGE